MPGILPKPHSNKVAHAAERAALAVGETQDVKMSGDASGPPQTNGVHDPVNGNCANGADPLSLAQERKAPTALDALVDQLPPEIGHLTEGYISFGGLVGRLVQETFNGLTEVINDMAEPASSQPASNGVLNHVNHQVNGNHSGDTSPANVQKKLRLLNFASDRRAQFIKILVLSRWARQAEAVSRVIDLKVWLGEKEVEYNNAVWWMGELKRILVNAKEPNPDLKTALEVLSLREASWLPDLGYLPPERLSSQRTLDLLRRINTLLSIRLNLHEKIPLAMRDFSIGSGRATFRVSDEFEVDLSIADDDPSKQLYFIDFRFGFSPTPGGVPIGRLRDELEGRANEILSRDGLEGLYDFLHNLVLTHKLSILRNQAFEMARGYWSEHLKVEPVHRNLVVQYWCNRPGRGKNWIEVGIKRGSGNRIWSLEGVMTRIPHIALRWFRGGKEVMDVNVNLGLGDLSMTHILKQIIALHTSFNLTGISDKLNEGILYSGGTLKLQRKTSVTEPADASLLVQLTLSKAVKVIQEPISGRFNVLPASGLNNRAEFELNRLVSPATEGSFQLAYLRCITSQEEVDAVARCMGWETVRSLNPSQEAMSQFFTKGTQRRTFYRRPAWSPSWILAFTAGFEGDFYWVVELFDGTSAPDLTTSKAPTRRTIRAAYKVVSDPTKSLVMESSYPVLSQVERSAVGMISQFNDTRHLSVSRIPHKVQIRSNPSTGSSRIAVFLRLPSRKAPPNLHSPSDLALPWANEIVRLDYRGLNASHSSAIHVCSARMNMSIAHIKDLTSSISSVAFHANSGAFAFEVRSRIGETSIPTLTNRLSAIDRLLNFVSTIKTHNLRLNNASLSQLEFTYQSPPTPLKATIHYPHDAPMNLSLSSPNPHFRILDHLTARLRSEGLGPVITLMRVTLPLLRCLVNLESSHTNHDISVVAHSEEWYHVKYSAPLPRAGFDIHLRYRQDDPYWYIPEPSIKKGDAVMDEEKWRSLLKAVLREKVPGWWRGMNGGIVATWQGIESAVQKLDEMFVNARHVPQESRPAKRKADGEIVEID